MLITMILTTLKNLMCNRIKPRFFYNERDDDFSVKIIDQKHEAVMKTETSIFKRAECSDSLTKH